MTDLWYAFAAMNPLDYVYRSVGAHIEQLNEDDPETQYLLKYIHNSGQ